jgi:integrase/recombinase XerD
MARKRKLPAWLQPSEVAALKAVPNTRCPTGLRNRAVLEVLHLMGLRNSEVCNIRRTDIGWRSRKLMVRGGKGGKDRPLRIPQVVMPWMEAWDGRRHRGAEFFFCTLAGGQLDGRYLRQLVRRLAEKAGVERPERVHPHAFRHTFATETLRRGVDVRKLQVMLGHENLATTEQYLHATEDDVLDAMDTFADLEE